MPEPIPYRALLAGGWRDLEFEPFKPGIDAHFILRGEPAIAVLKYAPGAVAPLHLHRAAEAIFMLDGSQSDDHGTYRAGDMIVNLPGSKHRVTSETGCVALLHWSKPVEFLE